MNRNSTMELELLRARWRRARSEMGVGEPGTPGFGRGGLAHALDDVRLRLVILPRDPERFVVEVDDALMEEWKQAVELSGMGGTPFWASTGLCAEGLVRYESPDDKTWSRYLALTRCGGIDLGLGTDVTWAVPPGTHCLHLVVAVARAAEACHRFGWAVERVGLSGPFEVFLALPNIRSMVLGGFERHGYDRRIAPHGIEDRDAVWWRRELDEWPADEGVRDLAYSLGDCIESAWGSRMRRWLVHPRDGGPARFACENMQW